MHIYIDESGKFTPHDGVTNEVSTVAAVVVPTTQRERLFAAFRDLRERIRPGATELKGNSLEEAEAAEILALLAKFEVLAEICAIDAGVHHQAAVESFRERQAQKILAGLPQNASAELVAEVEGLAALTRRLPAQLLIQGYMMILLLQRTIETATMYFAQRRPAELGEFHWVIDAKDFAQGVTSGERFWIELVLPAAEAESMKAPMALIEWGDYSHFERFRIDPSELQEAQRARFSDPHDPAGRFTDIERVLREHLSFPRSGDDLGLQMADVVANVAARAFNQRLQPEGWRSLGKLMIRRSRHALPYVALRANPSDSLPAPENSHHASVLWELNPLGRSMVPPKHQHRLTDSTSRWG